MPSNEEAVKQIKNAISGVANNLEKVITERIQSKQCEDLKHALSQAIGQLNKIVDSLPTDPKHFDMPIAGSKAPNSGGENEPGSFHQ